MKQIRLHFFPGVPGAVTSRKKGSQVLPDLGQPLLRQGLGGAVQRRVAARSTHLQEVGFSGPHVGLSEGNNFEFITPYNGLLYF